MKIVGLPLNKLKRLPVVNNPSGLSLFYFFISPLLSIILLTLGSSFFTTFVSITMDSEGSSQFVIGCIHSAFYAGMLIGALSLEPFIRSLGHIRAYTVFASIISLTILSQSFNTAPFFWMLMRFIFGFCMTGIYIVIESWLLANATLNTRASVLSLYMIVLYATQTISHELLNFMTLNTLIPFVCAALLCSLSSIPLAMTAMPAPEIEKPQTKNLKAIWSASPYGFIGCIFSGFILSAIFSFVPNFAEYYHFPVSTLMQMTIAGGCLLQWPIARLSDHFPRHLVLLGVSLIIAFSAMCILVFYSQKNLVYLFSFILGGCSFSLYTVSIATVCDNLKTTQMVNANAVLLFAYGLGSVLGPVIASLFMDWISIRSLYGYITLVTVLLILVGLFGGHGAFKKVIKNSTE